ncbi:MAG: hypothetical protein WDO69_08705 [Pseudomonadota bacterium]
MRASSPGGLEQASVVAKRMGISSSSAYLWLKKAAPVSSTPVFARVAPTRASSIPLEVAGAVLIVERGFDGLAES